MGAQSLADVYPSSHLQYLYLVGNEISDNILYTVEDFSWQQYCQDQLCHSNAPWNSNGYTSAQYKDDFKLHDRKPADKAKPRKASHQQVTSTHSFPQKQVSIVELDQKFFQNDVHINRFVATWFSLLSITKQQPSLVGLLSDKPNQSSNMLITITLLLGFFGVIYKKREAFKTIFQTSSRFIQNLSLWKKEQSFKRFWLKSELSTSNNSLSGKPLV